MRVVNLTIPLYPGMPVGNVWAWDRPFETEDIVDTEQHGFHLFAINMFSETGTRIMWSAMTQKVVEVDALQLDYSKMVNAEAVVIHLPKKDNEEINPEDIDRTLAKDPDYRDGDAVLLHTGWGDNQRYKKIGDDYSIKTPHFSNAGAQRTVEVMTGKKSLLLVTDCAYIGNGGGAHMIPEWVSRKPWDRLPWPSPQCKSYLKHYTREKSRADWGSSKILCDNLYVVGAAANLGALTKKRVKVTVLPLMIEGGAGSPVSIVAVEE
jgi:kynurenine formamidase